MVQCENCFCLEACREHYRVSESGIRKGNGCGCFVDSTKYAEVVHGRWIDNTDENGFLCNAWRKCSACGGLNYSKRPPYCPNCGAKMDKEN